MQTAIEPQANPGVNCNPGEVIVTDNLWKTYVMGEQEVHALRGVNLRIRYNEYVAIMGPSGSGKSTLMNLIGCLDSPSQGSYCLNGHDVSRLSDDELARIRNKEIGFVFQTFNLLALQPALSVQRLCWSRSAWARACITSRMRCPADSASVSPSPAPS
jgi:putative ABC transport system ATP-binding protein